LQDFEATYFSAKQSESPLFVDIFKQQSSLTPELIQELKKLCETDKLVNEGVLARLIKAVPEGYRPYIAYNQAVNALNDNDFTTSERGVKHIIVTYPQYLVQVPESLTLYLNFHLIDDIKVYPNTFWQFFNQWLAIHKTRISTENLDALGWLLFDIVLANPELVRMSHSHALINLYKAHPSMFSTKFTYICFSTFTEKPNIAFDAGALDLFSLPNAEKNKEKFVETLDKMIGGLIAASQRSFFGESIPMSVITNQVEQLSKAFIQAVNTHETPPKNTIALEAFKVVNKYIQEYSHQFTSRTTFLDAFTKAYTQLLETFPNNKTKEVYSQDLSTLTNMSFTVPFKKLIEHGASLREFQAFFKKNPPPATYGFSWGAICNQISKSHFEADEIPTIVDFIKYLSFKLDRMEVLISEIKHFVEQYKNMSQKHNCEHPTVFYAQLLSALFKERAFAPIMVYTFVKEYGLTFTEQYAFEPKNYNAIGDFLEWLSKQSKSAINYDKDFISHLVSHLEEINKLKNLKKLGATLVKARALIA
jgi:hypothetical protein